LVDVVVLLADEVVMMTVLLDVGDAVEDVTVSLVHGSVVVCCVVTSVTYAVVVERTVVVDGANAVGMTGTDHESAQGW
jgi:hypothetical protein